MAEDKKTRAHSAMGGKKSKKSKAKGGKKKVHEIHLRRADSGELLAKHKHAPDAGMDIPDEEHVVPEGGVQQHVDEHMPAEMPPQGAAPAPAAGPAPAAAASMAGM